MAWHYVPLPLFKESNYLYTVPLERVSYQLKFYYNERMEQWIMDLLYADGVPIVLGQALIANYPLFSEYVIEPTGFFFLEPIGENKNQTVINPFELEKYYRLFYLYEDGEE